MLRGARMHAVRELPPIMVSNYDFDRLVAFGLAEGHGADRDIGFLLSELRRATLYPALDLPEEVVAVNCRVTYRIDSDPESRTRFLVYPGEFRDADEDVSAASSIGIALLGLRAGDRMSFHDGLTSREHEIEVESVDFRFIEDGLRTTRTLDDS